MAGNNKNNCGPCAYRSVNKNSEFWCPECDDSMCSNCNEHHSGGRLTRDHIVIPIEHYKKLPEFARHLSSNCDQHNAPFQNYCVTHEELCCRKCIDQRHSKCQGLPAVDDYLENTRHSFALEQLTETLKNIVSFCDDTIKSKKQSMEAFRAKSKELEKQIQTAKTKINKELDKLLENINTYNLVNEADTQGVIQKLSIHQKETKEIQENISVLTQYASNIQLFLASKLVKEKVKATEDNIIELQTKGKLNKTSLIFKENVAFSNLQRRPMNLASTTVNSVPPLRVYKSGKSNELHILTVVSRPLSVMRVALHKRIRLPNDISIMGCLLLPNKDILLTGDFFVYFVDKNGSVTSKLQLRMAYDLALIDDNTIAVSDDACITFVGISEKRVKMQIKAGGYAFGISKAGSNVIYSTDKAKLKELNIETRTVSDMNINNPIVQAYLATSRDKIYYSNWRDNTVTCYKDDGTVNWIFKNDDVLKKPSGVTVGNEGTIFVAGLESQNIVMISADGKNHKEVKTDTAGIRNPRTIYFCPENRLLLVCSERSFVAVYTVE